NGTAQCSQARTSNTRFRSDMATAETIQKQAEEFRVRYQAVRAQSGRVIVGHDEIVHGVLTCLFVGGHCLLEGVPGLGKTLLVRTLAKVLDLDFSQIGRASWRGR